jgi:phosphoglycolate phosphatase
MYVFFDLDGTLTDPKEGIVACIQFALSSLNIEIDEDVKLETFIGPPLRDTFRQLCENEILAEKAVNLYRERFSNTGLYESGYLKAYWIFRTHS